MKEYQSKTKKKSTPNPFTSAETSITRHGLKSEARLAKNMGSKLMSGSGAKDGRKSDAILDTPEYRFRIESKATIHKSFSIKLEILEKIRSEALETGRTPVLTVSFTDELGRPVTSSSDFAVIPMYLFNEVFNSGD